MILVGLIAALLAAVSWAISAALYKQGGKYFSPITANLIRIIPALIFLALFGFLLNVYTLVPLVTTHELLLMFGSSLAAFVIGDTLYFLAIRQRNQSLEMSSWNCLKGDLRPELPIEIKLNP